MGSGHTWYGIRDCGLNNTDVLQGHPKEVSSNLPLCSGNCAPGIICPLHVPLLGDGVYELEKGFSDRKLRNRDVVKLRLGGVVTGSISQTLTGDVDMR